MQYSFTAAAPIRIMPAMNRYTHQFSARRYFLVDQTVIVSSAIDEAVNQVLLWTVQAMKRIAIVTARTKIVFAALWKYIASRMSPAKAEMNTTEEATFAASR